MDGKKSSSALPPIRPVGSQNQREIERARTLVAQVLGERAEPHLARENVPMIARNPQILAHKKVIQPPRREPTIAEIEAAAKAKRAQKQRLATGNSGPVSKSTTTTLQNLAQKNPTFSQNSAQKDPTNAQNFSRNPARANPQNPQNFAQKNANFAPQNSPKNARAPKRTDAEIAAAATLFAKHSATRELKKRETVKRYHAAWQNYYQRYYEQYYMAAMAEQRRELEAEQADLARKIGTKIARTPKDEENELKNDLKNRIRHNAKRVRKSRHFVPAVIAILVVAVLLFVQYNSVLFAAFANFVSPGNADSQSIIVGTGLDQPISPDSRIIIPKINVNAPVNFDITNVGEASAQQALQNGPIHYPITGANAFPGEKGNVAILGHSSADWFEPGDYKFIFVQLSRLAVGDLFYIDYQGARYTYQITKSAIITPTDIAALDLGDEKPFATLITCDPPGTAWNRLIVVGEQISPSPDKAAAPSANVAQSPAITGTPPTLFEKIFGAQ